MGDRPDEYETLFDKSFKTEAKVYDKDGKFLKTLSGVIKPLHDW